MNFNILFLSGIYLAGVISFFSPCIFPLLPVYLNILSTGGKNSIFKTILFILGLSTSFVLLGFGIGTIGVLLKSNTFRIISSVFIIIFGIIQMELIKFQFLEKTKLLSLNVKNTDSPFYSFVFGFTFSLGWTPCIGPTLGSIFFLAGINPSPIYSSFLLLIYVVGLATPFLFFSFTYKHLAKRLKIVKNNLGLIKKIGGAMLVLMGILLLTNKFNLFVTV